MLFHLLNAFSLRPKTRDSEAEAAVFLRILYFRIFPPEPWYTMGYAIQTLDCMFQIDWGGNRLKGPFPITRTFPHPRPVLLWLGCGMLASHRTLMPWLLPSCFGGFCLSAGRV